MSNFILYIIFGLVGALVVLYFAKKNLRRKYKFSKNKVEDFEDMEKIWLEYYRKNQNIFVYKVVIFTIAVVAMLFAYDIKALNLLAIIAGTIIIILRDYIFSFITFFYILSVYKIGDDVRTDTMLGEILRINPLYVAIAGKDEDGEYNGKLNRIPNSVFMTSRIEAQELKADDYRRVLISVIYTHEKFKQNFDAWLDTVRKFLEETLPARPLERVGHFKGYLGVKYKINYDYNERGEVIVRISFISRPPKNIELKERIIEFVESMRPLPEKEESKSKKSIAK